MLKEPLQIQPGIILPLTNLHSQQVRLGSELWIQHHWEIMGWGKSLELCPLLSVLCFQGKPGFMACQSWGKLPVWPAAALVVQGQPLEPSFVLFAERSWGSPLTLGSAPWGCWQILGADWGLEVEPRQGNGVILSLFLLHKAQLCGALNLVTLLSRLIVHQVNKAFSSHHCLAGIIPPWSDSKEKKKKYNPAWDSLYNCKCHCCTRNGMYWLKSLNRREGKWADDSSKIIFSIEYGLRPSKEEKEKLKWCAGEKGICYHLFA